MDAVAPLVVLPTNGAACDERIVGGKAANLSRLASSGFRVPAGFCLSVAAYEAFVEHHRIDSAIRMELGRKNLDEMRWEELWDAALRIRSLFLSNPLTPPLRQALRSALAGLEGGGSLAVRSSAPGEDSGEMSFAGLHESFTDVGTVPEIEKSVRLVWASLWSDAALLYRRELGLDPEASRMAVLIQAMTDADRSGVAFGGDPRGGNPNVAIVEAVPGRCRLLVDGVSDPDHWEIDRHSREIVTWRPGDRDGSPAGVQREPLLDGDDLDAILDAVQQVEDLFGWLPDVEWTGGAASLTLLQARPITTTGPDPDKERSRSMSLRPGDVRLRELRDLVVGRLIPELEEQGQRFSDERLEQLDDVGLAETIEQRSAALEKWKKVYWDLFIPFAHGVRRLATYYNDRVSPKDPYEFVGLLRNQPLLATQRNDAIRNLAACLALDDSLRHALATVLASDEGVATWADLRERLMGPTGAEGFVRDFEEMSRRFLDITFDSKRLQVAPGPVLRNILELSQSDGPCESRTEVPRSVEALEQRLLDAVGPEHHDEARERIDIGRLSWKLRDDDNLLVSRVESQLLRALELAAARLREAGRAVGDSPPTVDSTPAVLRALRDPAAGPVDLTAAGSKAESGAPAGNPAETPRQLIGQPASPGLISGTVRVLRDGSDLGKFRQGEILVCDAIQPNMTHLAMLAAAIVERRGGMLIHGAIIARELGIPCVNGVRDATRIFGDGDLVTVDGYLGILSIGRPELELELRPDP